MVEEIKSSGSIISSGSSRNNVIPTTPNNCNAETLSWNNCSGTIESKNHDETSTIINSNKSFIGNSTFKCNNGNWEKIESSCDEILFYLHANGVTVLCPNANIGESGVVDGKTYTRRIKSQITKSNAASTCTSGIKDMRNMENQLAGDISSWDTSQVISMFGMFRGTIIYSPSIGNWNTSKVTDMSEMFVNSRFNNYIGNWDTSKVTAMDAMFYNAQEFNYSISNWCVKLISSKPPSFDTGSKFKNKPTQQPQWGINRPSCPSI